MIRTSLASFLTVLALAPLAVGAGSCASRDVDTLPSSSPPPAARPVDAQVEPLPPDHGLWTKDSSLPTSCALNGPPPKAPAGCSVVLEGGPTSCKPVSLWTTYAQTTCQAQGRGLTKLDPCTPCGGGNYRYVQYLCCDGAPGPKTDAGVDVR